MELPGGCPNERIIRAFFFLNLCEVRNDHSNGTHTSVKAAAARCDGGDVLRISGCFNLINDTTPEAMTSHATAFTTSVTGAMTGAFAVWLRHEK